MANQRTDKIKKLCFAGIMAALCYVGYAVFPAISASGTKVHIGNAFVVLGALFLGPFYGGFAGAIGLTLADLLTGFAESAPRTFITKLVMGLIIGLFAHTVAKLYKKQPKGYVVKWTIISTAIGLAFNCIFEPALKYVWYTLLIPNADKAESAIKSLLAITTYTTLINAGINAVIGIMLYLALRPVLTRAGIIKLED